MKNPANLGGDSNPVLVVVMGVSGAGKSTVSQALAEQCGYLYLDADDFHSVEARTRMAAGTPLTDDMRKPWIETICQHLRELAANNTDVVLAFSGLRKVHREPLRHCGYQVQFLFLDGDRETISARMQARTGHFMPSSLLDSQFACLERPDTEADVHALDITPPLPEMLDEAVAVIKERRSRSQLTTE
ncbi:gluconokinase [Marinimicrobium sp. ABcell2]|uniref:gluconokinase n=1 Tax=Marinimicrobium sp. ABcell2 TaxID=3069751 RepID=UPI0027B64CE3|nr:gluconokinase [Marinimicrobium sp. ABcell2]MDQ2077712.1 gluconokinase [Marinimicrobium sp. ABcell2]